MSFISGIISAITGASAAKSAASSQERSAAQASKIQYQMFKEGKTFLKKQLEQAREDVAPWRKAGKQALNTLTGMLAETKFPGLKAPGEFKKSPYYKFAKEEGQKAVERSAAARTGLISGKAIKAGARYAEGLASTEYNNWMNQELNRYNAKLQGYNARLAPYMELAGLGSNTSNVLTGANLTTGANVANLAAGAGQGLAQTALYGGAARAGGYINAANAITGGLQGVSQTIPNALGAYYLLQNPLTSSRNAFAGAAWA